MKVLHVCAMRELEPGKLRYYSGTMWSKEDLSTTEGYSGIRKTIAEGWGLDSTDGIVVLSLTVLEEKA